MRTQRTPIIEQQNSLRLIACVKPEALSFFHAHGCSVQQRQQGGDMVIFPPGSRKEPLSPTSQICSTITLPDGTIITAMDCYTRYIFLVIDSVRGSSRHLSQ